MGELVHIEIESSQKNDTGQRAAEYHRAKRLRFEFRLVAYVIPVDE